MFSSRMFMTRQRLKKLKSERHHFSLTFRHLNVIGVQMVEETLTHNVVDCQAAAVMWWRSRRWHRLNYVEGRLCCKEVLHWSCPRTCLREVSWSMWTTSNSQRKLLACWHFFHYDRTSSAITCKTQMFTLTLRVIVKYLCGHPRVLAGPYQNVCLCGGQPV